MEPSWGLWHRFPLGPHVVCRRSIAQEFARLTDVHSLVHTFSSIVSCNACAIVKLHGFHGHFVVDDQLKAIALIPATRLAAGTLRRHGDGHLNTSLSVRIVHSPAGFADIALRVICIPAGNRSTRLHIDDWPVENGGTSLVNHTVSRLRRQKSSTCVRW